MKNKQTQFFIIGFINKVSRAANVVVGLLLSALWYNVVTVTKQYKTMQHE